MSNEINAKKFRKAKSFSKWQIQYSFDQSAMIVQLFYDISKIEYFIPMLSHFLCNRNH